MTQSECAKIVAVLLAAFPNAKVTTKTSEVYERMLLDQEYPVVNAAVERLLATSRFMPTIAEIRDACLDLSTGERKAGGEAWGELLKAISRNGIYRSPGVDFVFTDPVVGRCVESMGWTNLCNSENAVADRARFIELYDKLAIGERRQRNAGALPAAQRLNSLTEADGDAASAQATSIIGNVAKQLTTPRAPS